MQQQQLWETYIGEAPADDRLAALCDEDTGATTTASSEFDTSSSDSDDSGASSDDALVPRMPPLKKPAKAAPPAKPKAAPVAKPAAPVAKPKPAAPETAWLRDMATAQRDASVRALDEARALADLAREAHALMAVPRATRTAAVLGTRTLSDARCRALLPREARDALALRGAELRLHAGALGDGTDAVLVTEAASGRVLWEVVAVATQ